MLNRRRRQELGEGRLGCVLWAMAFLLAGTIAWKAVPVKIANSEMYDFMEDQAKLAANVKPEDIKKGILLKAKDLNLPVHEENVMVERAGDNIRMSCAYTVAVDFPGYTYQWAVRHEVNRPIFIF